MSFTPNAARMSLRRRLLNTRHSAIVIGNLSSVWRIGTGSARSAPTPALQQTDEQQEARLNIILSGCGFG
jgi:hypothetical protein